MTTAIGTATSPVQGASVTRLRGDATFAAMVQGLGVFDQASVPVGQALPYVSLGDAIETPMNSMGSVCARGYECILTFHIWSQSRGFKVVQGIMGRIIVLLTRQPLVLPGQSHVGTWFLSSNAVQDPDGVTQHIVLRLVFRVQEDL